MQPPPDTTPTYWDAFYKLPLMLTGIIVILFVGMLVLITKVCKPAKTIWIFSIILTVWCAVYTTLGFVLGWFK